MGLTQLVCALHSNIAACHLKLAQQREQSMDKINTNEDDINEERERETHTERRRPKIDPKYKIDP